MSSWRRFPFIKQILLPSNFLLMKVCTQLFHFTFCVVLKALPLCAASPLLATGGADKTIKLTNYETKETLMELRAHDSAVLSLAFNPINPYVTRVSLFLLLLMYIICADGHRHHLLSGGMDGKHTLIDLGKKAVIQEFRQHTKFVIEYARLFWLLIFLIFLLLCFYRKDISRQRYMPYTDLTLSFLQSEMVTRRPPFCNRLT